MNGIKSKNSKKFIFLLEIGTHCLLAQRSYERLLECSQKGPDKICAPIEFLHIIHSLLTYSAVVSKIIFPRGRKGSMIMNRCSEIQNLLGISSSPCLEKLDVRNSLEHIDERYDKKLPSPPFSLKPLEISQDQQDGKTIRRFDPDKFEFWFFDQCIEINPLISEINLISTKVKDAYKKLEN